MILLRDRWRRTALHQFWQGLEPIDRATWIVGIALAFAAAFSIEAVAHAWFAQVKAPSFTAPPFDLGFA